MAKVLKYVRARMDLLNFLARNGYSPGDKLPSERELGQAFRMSSVPLRRALDELAEQGVIEKVQGLGNFLRRPVTQMASQGTVVLLDIQTVKPLGIPVLARELQLMLADRRMDFQFIPALTPGNHIDRLLADATGILVVGRITPEWATYLEQLRQPLVVLGSNPFPDRFHTVAWDWQQASYLLTDHFIRQGCRNIGLLNGDLDYFPAQRMYEGYCQALRDHGVAYDKRHVIWLQGATYYQQIDRFMKDVALDALVVESGVIRHLFNWSWNHPRPQGVPMGIMVENTSQYIVADDSELIVRAVFDQPLLEAAIDVFFAVLAGSEQRVHHILKPRLAQEVSSSV